MRIKKYVVENIKDAMTLIKRELGDDAVILQTRQIRKGGFLGIGAKKFIEVTAVGEEKQEKRMRHEIPNNLGNLNDGMYKLKKVLAKNMKDPSKIDLKNNRIERDLKEIKDMILNMEKKLTKSKLISENEMLRKVNDSLKEYGLDDELIENIITALSESKMYEDEKTLKENISKILHDILKTEKVKFDLGSRIVFVGPTGVGKTTTLAKFAAMMKMEDENRKIGMITLDTFKISGADQLKVYSDILKIPFKSFYTLDELDEFTPELIHFDIILVDTVGRSPKALNYMNELKKMMDILQPTHVFLLVSLTTNPKDAVRIIEKFSKCDPTHLILTKLDETENLSNLFNISFKSKIPISHITNGQNIPDDLEEINSEKLIDDLLKEVFRYG